MAKPATLACEGQVAATPPDPNLQLGRAPRSAQRVLVGTQGGRRVLRDYSHLGSAGGTCTSRGCLGEREGSQQMRGTGQFLEGPMVSGQEPGVSPWGLP